MNRRYRQIILILLCFSFLLWNTSPAAASEKGLSVISTSIRNNQKNVNVEFLLKIIFSDTVKTGTAYKSISLTNGKNNIAISTSIRKNTLSIRSVKPLQNSTSYTVTLPAGAIKNRKGSINKKTISIQFTTAADTSATLQLDFPSTIANAHFGYLGEYAFTDNIWIRPHPGPFSWGNVEATKGTYTWSSIDNRVKSWQNNSLGIIATIWPYAAWDQAYYSDKPSVANKFPEFLPEHRYAPHDTQAYTNWLKALIERYDGDGIDDMPGLKYPIRHWEIINEPEMTDGNMCFFQGTSEEYLSVLKLSYEAIKSADSNAVVLSGGQSRLNDSANTYWTSILEGGKNYFDLGNIHDLGQMKGDFSAGAYRSFLNTSGLNDKAFWITEALLGSKRSPGYAGQSEDDFAQLTMEYVASAFADGAGVIINVGSGDPSGGPGKAADETYRLMIKKLNYFSTVTKISDKVICFTMPDQSLIYVMWGGSTLPAGTTGTVNTITYSGTQASIDASKVIAEVPMLVEVSK